MAYKFRGIENKKQLTIFLQNITRWEDMDVKFSVPNVVGLIGLYKFYIVRDLGKMWMQAPYYSEVQTLFKEYIGKKAMPSLNTQVYAGVITVILVLMLSVYFVYRCVVFMLCKVKAKVD